MTDLDNLRVIKLCCQELSIWLSGIAIGTIAVTHFEEPIWLVPEGIAIVLLVASMILNRMIDSMKLLEDLTWESERV